MTDPVDKCIFCGNPDASKLTWEHLWPRWSHRQIARSMRKWNAVRGIERIEVDSVAVSGVKTLKKGGDIHDMQIRCVCGGDAKTTCNNGWMRNLEEQARPFLKPLMEGEECRISTEEQRVIAAWISLKSMVAEYNEIGVVTTSQSDRDRLRLTQMPPEQGWGIWVGNLERKDWPGYMASTPFAFWPEPERAHLLGVSTDDFNGQSTFQVVKKLYIQVIRCQVPELVEKWKFDVRASSKLRKIWPPSGYSLVWPPPVMNDMDADYVASAFTVAARRAVQRALAKSLDRPT